MWNVKLLQHIIMNQEGMQNESFPFRLKEKFVFSCSHFVFLLDPKNFPFLIIQKHKHGVRLFGGF